VLVVVIAGPEAVVIEQTEIEPVDVCVNERTPLISVLETVKSAPSETATDVPPEFD